MRKIKLHEVIILILGLLFLFKGLTKKLPKTFDRVLTMEALTIKVVMLIVGIGFILFAIISFLRKESLIREKKVRSFVINGMLVLGSLFISALLIEVFLQITTPQGCRQTDEVFHHFYIPNCNSTFSSTEWQTKVSINSVGIRDDPIQPKENYDVRILMLGDSFTWGYGVEQNETFSEVVQQQLNHEGVKADVLNAGVTSYSPTLQYLYLREKGIKLKPDVVVLNFDMSDVQDDYLREQEAIFDETGELVSVPNPEKKSFLLDLRKEIKITALINSIFIGIDRILPPPTKIEKPFLYDIAYDRYGITRFSEVTNESVHWQRTFSYILKMKELCEKERCKLVLAVYPYAHQISPIEWEEGRHNSGLLTGVIYSDRAEKKLQAFAEEQNISFISMFEGFRESSVTPLYFSYDGHFNPSGHALAGKVLSEELIKRKIVQNQ